MNETEQTASNINHSETPQEPSHPLAAGVGAAGGGVAGAAIGGKVGGKLGAAVGGIAGAIAGGLAGEAIAEIAEELVEETSPSFSLGLGADTRAIELPAHYSWEQLQALSRPQPDVT